MNDWQIPQQIVYLLKTLVWPSGDKIFFGGATTGDDATVAPLDPDGVLKIHTLPCAIVRPLDKKLMQTDGSRPEEVDITIEVVLVCSVPGDGDAGSSLLGRNQLAGDVGRGLLEIEEKVQEKLELVMDWMGVRFSFQGASSASISAIHEDGNVVSRSLIYQARGTRQKTYTPARRLRSTGSISLTWDIFPDRFDKKKFRLFRDTIKITSVGQGTELVLASDFAVSKIDSPGAGTWYYGLFCIYEEPGNSILQASEAINLKVTV